MKSTRFCQHICLRVLPQMTQILDDESQSRILKILGEACMFTSDVEESKQATENVFEKLMVSVGLLSLLFSPVPLLNGVFAFAGIHAAPSRGRRGGCGGRG